MNLLLAYRTGEAQVVRHAGAHQVVYRAGVHHLKPQDPRGLCAQRAYTYKGAT